jgi:predicted regulator of Ras-like GTPase activity (Roadblock/LC7/MglB family)
MMLPEPQPNSEVQGFTWLLARFAAETANVVEAIVVSADGLLIAMSAARPRAEADRLAAITSAIISLAGAASNLHDLGESNKIIMDLDRGYLLVRTLGAGSVLGVLATKKADLGGLAYEMTMFARRAGNLLTPQLVAELQVQAAY